MDSRFEVLWRNRTPFDAELDDLTLEARLSWEATLREDENGRVSDRMNVQGMKSV